MSSTTTKTGLLVCMVLILLLLSASTTGGLINSIKNEPLEDIPTKNVILPDAHLYYDALKILYANVEFDDPGAVIDVNLSNITSEEVNLRCTQKVYVHVENQLIFSRIVWSSIITLNDEYLAGVGTSATVWELNDWQINRSLGYLTWNRSNSANISIIIALTGIPPWLPFLHWIHVWVDVLYLMGESIPISKYFSETVIYYAHIHT